MRRRRSAGGGRPPTCGWVRRSAAPSSRLPSWVPACSRHPHRRCHRPIPPHRARACGRVHFRESEPGCREHLGSAVVELFVANASDDQVAALVRHFADTPGARDNAGTPLSNHDEIRFASAGNTLLRRLFEPITTRIAITQNLSIRSPGRAAESRLEAEQTLTWIKVRDSARAAESARHHIRMAKKSALRALRAKMAEPTATQLLG
ncbi:FCD domain-containing protein [Nocardia sp. NPDC052278]|uniref:FCD domain-containing protein n=1 Tax=Nocardia sp. NPDC052278 TaxID=3364328 RepID=UPI0037C6DAE7